MRDVCVMCWLQQQQQQFVAGRPAARIDASELAGGCGGRMRGHAVARLLGKVSAHCAVCAGTCLATTCVFQVLGRAAVPHRLATHTQQPSKTDCREPATNERRPTPLVQPAPGPKKAWESNAPTPPLVHYSTQPCTQHVLGREDSRSAALQGQADDSEDAKRQHHLWSFLGCLRAGPPAGVTASMRPEIDSH